MKNIKLVIEYDGSRYDGWKVATSGKAITIQDKIESVLEKMLGKKTELIGAARTESGVHAYGQVANFKADTSMKPYQIKHYLNRYLPQDIAVVEVMEVPERFHSSYNAKSFIYQYKISVAEVNNVFERKYNYYSFDKLDIKLMKEASNTIIGKHDFKAFSDNKRMKKSTVREIYSIDIYGDSNEVIITIHGDDFWPNMVRIIVGTLMEIGRGDREVSDMKDILESKDREKAGETAAAQGLFLQEVIY